MNIKFVGSELEILECLESIDDFSVQHYSSMKSYLPGTSHDDVLIISNSAISTNELVQEVADKIKAQKIYYIIQPQNLYFATSTVLESKNIKMICYNTSAAKLVDNICADLIGAYYSNSNVIVFYGASHGVGTTTISNSVAQIIADNCDKKVFLGFMQTGNGADYYKFEKRNSIDELKLKIVNRVLSISEVLSECHQLGNLYVLQGIKNFLYSMEYELSDIEYFIDLLSTNFDVVILDVGVDINYAICLGSLLYTKNRYLVVTPSPKVIESYYEIEGLLQKLGISKFSLILNDMQQELGRTENIVSKFPNALYFGSLPHSDYGWQAEIEKELLYKYPSKSYKNKILTLAAEIAKTVGIEIQVKGRRGLFFM